MSYDYKITIEVPGAFVSADNSDEEQDLDLEPYEEIGHVLRSALNMVSYNLPCPLAIVAMAVVEIYEQYWDTDIRPDDLADIQNAADELCASATEFLEIVKKRCKLNRD